MSIYGQDTGSNLNFEFSGGGSSGGGGGGGSFGSTRPTPKPGSSRFSKYDYTGSSADKEWSVSLGGIVVASDVNSNTSSVNHQLAIDWINSDWKRRKAMEAGNTTPLGYSSWRRVVDAYRQGLLSYDEAYNILITQFNYTPNIARATLGDSSIEDTEFDDDTLTPKPEEEEEEESTPMTDNERFLLIGVVVLAGLYGFIKK
tara:strand:- start:14 stop:616 length:603 start_codon:yes stop_codon:yes gene_type:complete